MWRFGSATPPKRCCASPKASICSSSERAGLNPLRNFVLGTTAVRLLKKCRLPMLVCKQPAHAPYRRVLVPVDLSRFSAAALSGALRVAPRARVRLFHALSGGREAEMRIVGLPEHVIQDYRAMAIGRAESKLRSIVAEVGHRVARVHAAVHQGDPLDLTLRQEERFGADLIVVRKHGDSGLGAFLMGSVTRRVLHNSRCDVLVVPKVGLDAVPAHAPVAAARPSTTLAQATNSGLVRSRLAPCPAPGAPIEGVVSTNGG